MLILKIKKNFEKINFLDKFFFVWMHCARVYPEFLIFISKFQNIYLCGVSKISKVTEGMLILLSKSEIGVLAAPMCTVRRPKIFRLFYLLTKGVQWCKSQENR